MRVALTLPNWEQLRDHVQRMLCDRDRIDFRQSSLVETTIYRSGRPCGVMFQLRGPRLVQTHAIWSADENRLLYYDSRGVRFADEHLAVSPEVLDGIANPQSIQSACVDSV